MEVLRAYFRERFSVDRLDVMLCENDNLAIAAIDVARHELGPTLPSELAIVRFDDISLASTEAYDVTMIRQPYHDMVDALIDMVIGRKPVGSVALTGEFIRRSTA